MRSGRLSTPTSSAIWDRCLMWRGCRRRNQRRRWKARSARRVNTARPHRDPCLHPLLGRMSAPARGRVPYCSGRPGTPFGVFGPAIRRATERLPGPTAGVVPARKARFILTTTADHVRTATSTDSGTPHRRPTLVIVLGLLAALGPFTIDLYLPALPEITGDLHTSGPAVQLTLTGTLVGLAVGQLIVGPLSDVLGRRRPLLAGIGVHVAASLLCAVSSGVLMLGTLRVLQGFGAAAAAVIAIAVVRDCFTGHRAA